METAAEVIECFRKKSVALWVENGRLRYSGPKGMLSVDDIERLQKSKAQIIARLSAESDAARPEPRLLPRKQRNAAPATFSQLAHWNLYELEERRAIRTVSFAVRLVGVLDTGALRSSLARLVNRHDALRTRIVIRTGVPTQEIAEAMNCELEIVDAAGEEAIQRHIEQFILQPVDVTKDPLFSARLLRLRDKTHVLVVVMEHMIADGYSLGIVSRDLFSMYEAIVSDGDAALPQVELQFSDYACWQQSTQLAWIQEQLPYWRSRLKDSGRVRFPQDVQAEGLPYLGRGSVTIHIDRELKSALMEWCRAQRTTLVMALFAAYVATVLRWCMADDAVFQYQTNGRFSSAIENTVGYFASVLYLRLQLREGDRFADLVKRCTYEYCQANEHADFSYLAAQLPRPDFMRNTVFNWIPESTPRRTGSLQYSPIRFVFPAPADFELDREPFALFTDLGSEIVADIYFSRNRFSEHSMRRFGCNLVQILSTIVKQPDQCLQAIPL